MWLQDSLAESEEKYRRAMVSNAQLHNEKSYLMYQVDTLKEELADMEERLWEKHREHGDKTKVSGSEVSGRRSRAEVTGLPSRF